MFGLLGGLYSHVTAQTELSILILGLDNAGKTTLLEQMKGIFKKMSGIPPDRIPPTIGLNIGKMDVSRCKCLFWDLGGQISMRSIWEKYYKEAHGLIFVVDSADPGRFEEARLAFETVRAHEELRDVPVVLIANKIDLPGAVGKEEIEKIFAASCANPALFRVVPSSCLTCEGVEDSVRWVVEEARDALRSLD
jgi:ADP-ribosylation factor related protein 1